MSEEPKEKPKEKSDFRKYVRIFWILFLSPVVLLFLLVWMVAIGMFGPLPSTEELQNPKSNLASVIYTSDHKVLGKYYAENRVNVRYEELNPNLVQALIATEDARFKEHSGVDGRGLARVFVRTIIGGNESAGGGSTLSQQLAKMLFPREPKSNKFKMVIRKIKEWIIASKLEREYTKEEILTMYLNKFDFLNQAVGIKSAAQIYFSTTPDSLNMQQSAMLVGMAKNPSIYNPLRRPDTTMQRREVVMSQMVKYGYLTRKAYDSLRVLPLALKFQAEDHNEGLATYFREYLRNEFLRKWCAQNKKPDGTEYNIYRDGLRIYTTLDSRMQRYAEEAVSEHMNDLQVLFDKDCKRKKNAPFAWNVNKKEIDEIMTKAMHRSERYKMLEKTGLNEEQIKFKFTQKLPMRVFTWKGEKDTVMSPWDSIRYYKAFLQTGFMSMEPQTGFVKAWVGGINHHHFKYDHVQVGHARQVGSTFKPFVYAMAIQEGFSPCYRIPNVPVTIHFDDKDWTPKNSDGPNSKLNGKMLTLQQALANSVNYISAYIMKQFGPRPIVDLVRRMGITAPIEPVPAICLGTPEISVFEMVGANSTFANKGRWIEPIFVTRIEDRNGKVLADFTSKTEEAMSEEKAYIMLALMKGVVNHGTGVRLKYRYKLNMPIAGKTGTTQNNSDGWFMGLTPDLVSGVWVGGEDRSVHFNSTEEGQGASMALPIWAKYMQKVYADKSLKVTQKDFEKPAKKIDIEMDCSKYDKELQNDNIDTDDYDFTDPENQEP